MQAALGLLRICTRLLPYKESSAEALLKSLQLVLRLDPHVAWDLAQHIAAELLKLVKSSAAYIRSLSPHKPPLFSLSLPLPPLVIPSSSLYSSGPSNL